MKVLSKAIKLLLILSSHHLMGQEISVLNPDVEVLGIETFAINYDTLINELGLKPEKVKERDLIVYFYKYSSLFDNDTWIRYGVLLFNERKISEICFKNKNLDVQNLWVGDSENKKEASFKLPKNIERSLSEEELSGKFINQCEAIGESKKCPRNRIMVFAYFKNGKWNWAIAKFGISGLTNENPKIKNWKGAKGVFDWVFDFDSQAARRMP